MISPRQKGAVGENKLIDFLKEHTNIDFQRTPGSGSGSIKGDLHCPKGAFCIEVKNYKEDPLGSTILYNKSSLIPQWWSKLKTQSKGKHPLLFYRWNRSKWFVATSIKPTNTKNYIDFPSLGCYILEAAEWIKSEEIQWLLSKT